MRRSLLFIAVHLALLPAAAVAQRPSSAALEAAVAGGVTLACRHAATDHGQSENERTLRYEDPATQRRLSPRGERQSVQMGDAFRALGVPVGEVVASPMQRARRMAELMFGEARLDSLWHTRGDAYSERESERRAVLASVPARGTRIIVSHVGTLGSVIEGARGLEEGDCAVVRAEGTGFQLVGVVRWREWGRAARGGRTP